MKILTPTLAAIAASTALLMAGPAMAERVALKLPSPTIVTEGLIVACVKKSPKTAAGILASQLRAANKAKGAVTVKRSFCGNFLKTARVSAPVFLKAVQARLDEEPNSTADDDPAVQAAKKRKKTTTTTTTTGGTTTTITTTVETTTNDDGSTTVRETITIN